MDASHTQTIAEAVAAATQQAQQAAQQQQQQHQAPSPPLQTSSTSTVDNLTCQWQGCGERCDSAESLYDHVCERHVGRKSTNNLNLTCQWGACRTTTVKRDHITSHIRVHVPLKPHKCDFCGKAFKRPQDLKKHVKTHADDSVLMTSPSHGHHGRSSSGNQAVPSGYYSASHESSMHNPYSTYQPAMATGGAGASYHHAPAAAAQYAGYGNVSYPNSSIADIQSMDTRRRAIEALNEFLGDIKRRAIDPTNYYDVGHRLQSTALPLPVGSGYNTGYNNSANYSNHGFSSTASLLESFNNGTLSSHPSNNAAGGHGYSLPLPNARTKNDLQDIDRFLEQLQATVYETSNSHHQVQPPVIHTAFPGDYNNVGSNQGGFRPTNSPPNFQNHLQNSGMGGSSSALTPGVTSSASSGLDTPALTPASVSSYSSSGHSPVSSAGRPSFASSSMYPSLPAVTGMSDGSNYPTATSAPASALASGFDYERRYSGGKLMASKKEDTDKEDTDMEDVDDGSRTPKAVAPKPAEESKEPSAVEDAKDSKDAMEVDEAKDEKPKTASIDPALRTEKSQSPEAASTPAAAEDKRQEEWVENIRVIERLRSWIADRLKVGDYEDAEAEKPKQTESTDDADMKTVETAKMVAEKLAVVERANKMAEGETKYPSLPLSS